ncbi:hypothetical protein [Clostridium cellulovorans]|uniref:Uncharacterized protein n=1 Tax=Clostridium cellulovorans (strain ATCC 35296 / DSM 3052 / OCM 3 / 743B) TaxID=573061 RepID=D9SUY5_CLOC7|nr:hypothetical protein [Clostridium cellulovorans]ADL52960.1 hypothetical protein Clocel_3277 [Clostridium cellulovorans 743B]
MKKIDKDLIVWAINKIETEYKGEISLLLGRKGIGKVPEDGDDMAFDFFIPACDHGYSLARTFIIDDMGYDLFPMSWARIEGLAALNEGIAFCLADSEILYARNDADRERFELLRKTMFNNLKNKDYIYMKSLEKINTAMDIYKTMLFEKSLGNVRKAAGGIIEYLSQALAIINGTYIKRDYGYSERMEQLKTFSKIPTDFLKDYEEIIRAKDTEVIVKAVHSLIQETREFFEQFTPEVKSGNYNYEELAGWYEEARYTFRRIAYACKNNKFMECFHLGCYLQVEFDILTEEAGLKKMDLLGVYEDDNLSAFEKRADDIEKYILSEIERRGVVLRKYDNLEEFLLKQG